MPRADQPELGLRGHRDSYTLTPLLPGFDEPVFRLEYARLIAVLSRRVGLVHLEAIEDAVQFSLLRAIESWGPQAPENPTGWLYRVAYRHLIESLRKEARQKQIRHDAIEPYLSEAVEPETSFLPQEIDDELLRMLFIACDESIASESRLVVALKVLCGFDMKEIAARLFISEASAHKRWARARNRLRTCELRLEELSEQELSSRRGAVLRVLYLLFSEGAQSHHHQDALRLELCREALRLGHLLAGHPTIADEESSALLAWMLLHSARLPGRQASAGTLLLLEEQDRTKWDQELIAEGLHWLAQAAQGEHFSSYHAEAGVAAEHCLAASYRETNWERVVACYHLLEKESPSPLHRLNAAVALGEWQGPQAGLTALEAPSPPKWLEASYLWSSVLADLHQRAGNTREATRYQQEALSSAPHERIAELLRRRWARNAAEALSR